MRVRPVKEGGVVDIPDRKVLREIVSDIDGAIAHGCHTSQQRDAPGCEAAKVDGVAAIGTGDRRIHPKRPTLLRRHLKQTQRTEPPYHIMAAVSARQATVRADREKDAAAGAIKFLGNLR